MLLLMLMPFDGQCMADALIGLDLGVGVRSGRWAGAGSSSRLPSYLDGLGTRDSRGVGKNDLVYGRGVGWALLGVGADYYYTLRLLLRLRLMLLVGSGYCGCWST